MSTDDDSISPIIRLIGDAMHHAAYYESAKIGGRKMIAYQRMETACRELLEQLSVSDADERTLIYLLRRGQCNTHSEADPSPSDLGDGYTCSDCGKPLPDGTAYWCLEQKEETLKDHVITVHDAIWLGKWCHECAEKLNFANVIIPPKNE